MLIRYPGSKDKHLKFLDSHLKEQFLKSSGGVVEPFAGTASITFHMLKLKLANSYWINDLDESIAALWKTVKDDSAWLISQVENYTPKVDDFYSFKLNPGSTVREKAFRKLVIHQISYSGLGPMAGGPLGGRAQAGEYKIDARWRPVKLVKLIKETSELLNSVPGDITSLDWHEAIEKAKRESNFVYLDPPYYNQGEVLYTAGSLDHSKLADSLKSVKSWVLSYDDTPEIRELYKWAKVERLDVTSHLHHKTIGDLVIKPNR